MDNNNLFNAGDDMASLQALFGKKKPTGGGALPGGMNLDMGMGMDMGNLDDLPSFDDLDKLEAKLKGGDKKEADFKPMLPKVRMRDPATDSKRGASFSLAPPPKAFLPPPSAPGASPTATTTHTSSQPSTSTSMSRKNSTPFGHNMYPEVYASLYFASANTNPFPQTMYPGVYATLRFKLAKQQEEDEFEDFAMAPSSPSPSHNIASSNISNIVDDLPSFGELDKLGKENQEPKTEPISSAPAAATEAAFADFASFGDFPSPTELAQEDAEEEEAEELVLTDASTGKRISLDDMNKQLEAEMMWGRAKMQQEQREDKEKTKTMGQTAAGAQQIADAIARSSGQGIQFRFDQAGGSKLMPTGNAINPKIGGGIWGRKSSDTLSEGSSRGSGLWG